MKLFEATKIPVLTSALAAYTLRHNAIASNIANITTSGYRPKTVTFEDQLAGAVGQENIGGVRTNEKHMPIGGSQLADVEPATVEQKPSADGSASGVNNVDLDTEMAELAKNQIRFRLAARLITGVFRDIQTSIRGTT